MAAKQESGSERAVCGCRWMAPLAGGLRRFWGLMRLQVYEGKRTASILAGPERILSRRAGPGAAATQRSRLIPLRFVDKPAGCETISREPDSIHVVPGAVIGPPRDRGRLASR